MLESPKPLWTSMLPIPIRWKRKSMHLTEWHVSIMQTWIMLSFTFYPWHINNKPKTYITHSDNFCCMPNWGCKDKTRGCSNTELSLWETINLWKRKYVLWGTSSSSVMHLQKERPDICETCSTEISQRMCPKGQQLVICSITHFRNWVPGCNHPGTWTRFQLLSK